MTKDAKDVFRTTRRFPDGDRGEPSAFFIEVFRGVIAEGDPTQKKFEVQLEALLASLALDEE
jgi:hypothetical protein